MAVLKKEIINGFTCWDNGSFWTIFTEFRCGIRIAKDKKRLELHLAMLNAAEEEDHQGFLDSVEYSMLLQPTPIIRFHSDFLYAKEGLSKLELKLRKKLVKFDRLRTEHSSLASTQIENPKYLDLLVQTADPAYLTKAIANFVQFNNWKAIRSTVENEPNCLVRTEPIVECIEDILEKKLDLGYFPKVIEGYVENPSRYNNFFGSRDEYVLSITQKSGSPFTFDDQLAEVARQITSKSNTHLEKGRAIFDWMRKNISYDQKQRMRVEGKFDHIYRGALEVFRDKTGICGEQAFLYATLCRLNKMRSYYVLIPNGEIKRRRPKTESELPHACAALFLPDNRFILVDTTTPAGFDIKYQDFRICSDENTCVGYY